MSCRRWRSELVTGGDAVRRHFEGNIGQRMAGGIEHRIDGDARLVVEQNDQSVADADEGPFLAGGIAEIEARVLPSRWMAAAWPFCGFRI
jgi:hypothetical protein